LTLKGDRPMIRFEVPTDWRYVHLARASEARPTRQHESRVIGGL
jgi:hypothetical protein